MITTLIPAYKTQYTKDLLLSLVNQSFKDFKVIISDDSPNSSVINQLSQPEYKFLTSKLNIQVVEGPKKGSMKNVLSLLDRWNHSTPLVHILFDDDVIFPLFYQMHILAHTRTNIGCSVSFRWLGNENSTPVETSKLPLFISQSSARVDYVSSENLFSSVISNCTNWLGEFSNAVFSERNIDLIRESRLADYPYYGLGDIGLFLQSSLSLDTAIVKDHLSVFRKNPYQNTGNLSSISMKCSYVAWIALALGSLKLSKVSLNQAVMCIQKTNRLIIKNFNNDIEMLAFASLEQSYPIGSLEYENEFKKLWDNLLNSDISWTSSTQGSTS